MQDKNRINHASTFHNGEDLAVVYMYFWLEHAVYFEPWKKSRLRHYGRSNTDLPSTFGYASFSLSFVAVASLTYG